MQICIHALFCLTGLQIQGNGIVQAAKDEL